MEFGEIMVIAMFVIPAILAGMYALKGRAMGDTMSTCQYCYKMISVAAKACPYCRRSSPIAYHDRNWKKAWYNTPKFRFIAGYVLILFAEFILLGCLAYLVG